LASCNAFTLDDGCTPYHMLQHPLVCIKGSDRALWHLAPHQTGASHRARMRLLRRPLHRLCAGVNPPTKQEPRPDHTQVIPT
jgi:hypothetical protein